MLVDTPTVEPVNSAGDLGLYLNSEHRLVEGNAHRGGQLPCGSFLPSLTPLLPFPFFSLPSLPFSSLSL